MNSSQIKSAAKQLLRGRFSLAIAVALALGAVYALAVVFLDAALFLAGFVDYESGELVFTSLAYSLPAMSVFMLIIALLWVLLAMPLSLGAARWFFALADFGYPSADSLFYAFSKGQYLRSLEFSLRLFSVKLGWTLLCCAPGLLVSGAALIFGDLSEEAEITQATLTGGVYALGILLFAGGITVSAVICLRYFAAKYVFASSASVSAKDAVKLSTQIMKGRKTSLFSLLISFFGWLLLTVPTVGISLIYTVPLYHASRGIFAKGSIDTYLMQNKTAQEEEV